MVTFQKLIHDQRQPDYILLQSFRRNFPRSIALKMLNFPAQMQRDRVVLYTERFFDESNSPTAVKRKNTTPLPVFATSNFARVVRV